MRSFIFACLYQNADALLLYCTNLVVDRHTAVYVLHRNVDPRNVVDTAIAFSAAVRFHPATTLLRCHLDVSEDYVFDTAMSDATNGAAVPLYNQRHQNTQTQTQTQTTTPHTSNNTNTNNNNVRQGSEMFASSCPNSCGHWHAAGGQKQAGWQKPRATNTGRGWCTVAAKSPHPKGLCCAVLRE